MRKLNIFLYLRAYLQVYTYSSNLCQNSHPQAFGPILIPLFSGKIFRYSQHTSDW